MPKREIDLSFGAEERLWRSIDIDGAMANSKVRPRALRLQVSIVRERYGTKYQSILGKFNGIAEITASEASSISCQDVKSACIDDPNQENPGHALIAFFSEPGKDISKEMLQQARFLLASKMVIVQQPVKEI